MGVVRQCPGPGQSLPEVPASGRKTINLRRLTDLDLRINGRQQLGVGQT